LSLRARILSAFIGGILLAFALFVYWGSGVLRASYRQNVEEVLVDVAQLLAASLEQDLGADSIDTSSLGRVFEAYRARRFDAQIFDLRKDAPALAVYVTDDKGIVLYSSMNPADVGKDFSAWRDVHATLAGRYGARSTRTDPADGRTSVFYVAAPIRQNGRIVGVVSVIKDRQSIARFIEGALVRLTGVAALALAIALAFGTALFIWITRPLRILERYARDVAAGTEKVPPPRLSGREVRNLADAFEEMRSALEGRKTIERFTQALTHEIKAPLSSIKAAAELSMEPMPDDRRRKFLSNIASESDRAQWILENLLKLAALESKDTLDAVGPVDLGNAMAAATTGLLSLSEKKRVAIVRSDDNGGGPWIVQGDPFLIQQCFRNVLHNAIEFSPEGAAIRTQFSSKDGRIYASVEDKGSGIPAFAREKVWEKFFSLERPDTGKKGTGLGLSLVREVINLHGGRVSIESPIADGKGCRVTFEFRNT
jgi:two-component system sensor histidine kinase CreC